MKDISCASHASVLQNSLEVIKQFKWKTVKLELEQKTPTLMSSLSQLVGRASEQSPLICLLVSMIIKSRHNHMGLVQKAVSIMLYGYGTAKQVRFAWKRQKKCIFTL